MTGLRTLLSAAGFSLLAASAFAFGDGVKLPWEVGGPFELTNQDGETRGAADPDGKLQLLFFGYANCPGICSAALPMMAQIASDLEAEGVPTTPVMITIDPKLDSVETIGPGLGKIADNIVGLTGTSEELSVAYKAFNVEFEFLFEDPDYGPIYSHTGHIFVMDAEGKVLTLIPPVLPPDEVAKIVRGYATQGS
ncbi:MAG: SCO family protein [Pseudomonadota bacterium]